MDDECKHDWQPAGHRRNRDRIHNKGKGKYQAFKCSICGLFKRRFIQK